MFNKDSIFESIQRLDFRLCVRKLHAMIKIRISLSYKKCYQVNHDIENVYDLDLVDLFNE